MNISTQSIFHHPMICGYLRYLPLNLGGGIMARTQEKNSTSPTHRCGMTNMSLIIWQLEVGPTNQYAKLLTHLAIRRRVVPQQKEVQFHTIILMISTRLRLWTKLMKSYRLLTEPKKSGKTQPSPQRNEEEEPNREKRSNRLKENGYMKKDYLKLLLEENKITYRIDGYSVLIPINSLEDCLKIFIKEDLLIASGTFACIPEKNPNGLAYYGNELDYSCVLTYAKRKRDKHFVQYLVDLFQKDFNNYTDKVDYVEFRLVGLEAFSQD
eukprot:TRINITY_DN13674_c0_g2_i9.p1 TRINITY_DN13674_c0_g2~~TRINITY_DN13674_c0_g2_i9.p1  ORF type:complete len:267 (-),score=47.16 TRINITY_DN13674_c0_g2_i9:187-987(-)